MLREVVKIDEELCDGCGECIPNCHEGALQMIDGKTLAIACPKLDSGLESYVEKIKGLIDEAKINTLTVMMMQVPCCGGLMQMVKMAAGQAERKVPVKRIIVGVEGDILSEEWV